IAKMAGPAMAGQGNTLLILSFYGHKYVESEFALRIEFGRGNRLPVAACVRVPNFGPFRWHGVAGRHSAVRVDGTAGPPGPDDIRDQEPFQDASIQIMAGG